MWDWLISGIGEIGASSYRGRLLQRPLAPALFIDLITRCQHTVYHDLLSVHENLSHNSQTILIVDILNVFEGLYYFINFYEEISCKGVIEIDDLYC